MSVAAPVTQEELIHKIMDSVKLADIISIPKLKEEYKSIILQIHPDRCAHSDAADATAKLNSYKDRYENGVELKDDAGALNTNDYRIRFKGDKAALSESLDNYTRLKKIGEKGINWFLPDTMKLEGNELVAEFGVDEDKLPERVPIRAIPLTNVNLPQEHVNWVLNRILEFTALLEMKGYSHMGINPESVYFLPDEHLIKVVSFYHMTRLGGRPKTISAQYQNWYPKQLFETKTAYPKVDSDMAKKLAVYLMGDKSGVGIRLKKTHHRAFLDFVLSNHEDSRGCFLKYREFLKENFPKKFIELKM